MKVRFFTDHCIPNSVSELLVNRGFTVFRLRDELPIESADNLVIQKAKDLDAVLLTFDRDFLDIITYPPNQYNGIIALQVKNRPETLPHLLQQMENFLNKYPDHTYYKGCLILIEVHRIRIKR